MAETPEQWAKRVFYRELEPLKEMAAVKRKADRCDEAVRLLAEIVRGVVDWNTAVSTIIDTTNMPKWAGLEASRTFLSQIGAEQ